MLLNLVVLYYIISVALLLSKFKERIARFGGVATCLCWPLACRLRYYPSPKKGHATMILNANKQLAETQQTYY